MAMKNLIDEQKKKAIAPDPISAAAGSIPAANATKAALVNQASARPAWAASAANPSPAPQGQQSYQMFQPTTAATNQQLQMQRQEMGTNQSTSLTQMVAQLDPSIRKDAERAREWRIMSPQQRREEVDRLGMEQDARIAGQASTGTWEDRQKYALSLADPTGMFIDSYGRESPMYSPETAERIRYHQRKIEPAVARMMSSYDRTKWDGPQAYLDAASALPEVIEAGEFGKSIVFNIGRKYGTPTMKAQMEAEDRNMKLFEQAGTKKALEEIVQKMAQAGQVSPEYANGYRLTNDGTKELLRQVWLNKDSDPRAGQIVNEIMANSPVMWEERDGRVVPSESHKAMREEMAMRNEAQAKAQADEQKAMAAQQKAEADRAERVRAGEAQLAAMKEANPDYRGFVHPITGVVVDTPTPTQAGRQIPPGTRWTEEKRRNEHQASLVETQSLIQFSEQFPGIKTTSDLDEQIEAWAEMRTDPDAATKYPGLPKDDASFDFMVRKMREDFSAIQKAGGADGIRNRLARMQSISWDEEEE